MRFHKQIQGISVNCLRISVIFAIVYGCQCYESNAAESSNLQIKFSKFYDWAYPVRVENAYYSAVFNPDLSPKRYRWNSSGSRNEAYLGTNQQITPPVVYQSQVRPINAVFGYMVAFDPQYLLNGEQIIDETSTQLLSGLSTLTAAEKIVFSRDLQNVVLQIRSGVRLHEPDKGEANTGLHDKIKNIEQKIVILNDMIFPAGTSSARDVLATFEREPALEDFRRALTDERWRGFLEKVVAVQKPVEVIENSPWQHNAAFNGSSLVKIWKWDDGVSFKGAIILRYATFPKEGTNDFVKPTAWVEEVNMTGIGGAPPLTENYGQQPWLISFGFDRDLFMRAIKSPNDSSKPSDYLRPRGMDDPVFIGFAADTLGGPIRGSHKLVTRRTSCLECHGGVFSDGVLELESERSRAINSRFDLRYDSNQKAYKIGFPPYYR